jgi:hypothetical protein
MSDRGRLNAFRGDLLWNNQHIARDALDKLSQCFAASLRQTGFQRQQSAIELSEADMQGGGLDRR